MFLIYIIRSDRHLAEVWYLSRAPDVWIICSTSELSFLATLSVCLSNYWLCERKLLPTGWEMWDRPWVSPKPFRSC